MYSNHQVNVDNYDSDEDGDNDRMDWAATATAATAPNPAHTTNITKRKNQKQTPKGLLKQVNVRQPMPSQLHGKEAAGGDDDNEADGVVEPREQHPQVRTEIDNMLHLCQQSDKYKYFLGDADANEVDCTQLQQMLGRIPCRQQIENFFRDVYDARGSAPDEPLDWSINCVMRESNVSGLAGVIFAGPNVFVGFNISIQDPIIALLHYVLADDILASKVFCYIDYEHYMNEKRVVLRADSPHPIKTHLVQLQGMCFYSDVAFHTLGMLVKPANVENSHITIEQRSPYWTQDPIQ